MKKVILFTAFFAMLLVFKAEAKTPAYFEFGIFYSSLSPHGTWMELEPGFVVWRPTIMHRWAPYSSGRWIWTEYGWYWDSYEPFGHITYHYGRWYYDDYYGWIWVPDYEWAPAWVEWRYDNDYIGWAPLPPYATFSINVGIVFTNSYHTPYHHWHFIGYDHFYDPYPYNYYVAEKHKYRIHSRSKYRSDYSYRDGGVYNRGVDVDFVRKRTGREIDKRELYRTSDERELRNKGGRNDEKIRTFIASREDLRKDSDGYRNVKFERPDRKSSLLTSKVEIGDKNRRDNKSVREDRTDLSRSNSKNLEKKSRTEDSGLRTRTEQKTDAGIRDNRERNKNDIRMQKETGRQNTRDAGINRKNEMQKKNESAFRQQNDQNSKRNEINKRNEEFQKRKNTESPNIDTRRKSQEQKRETDFRMNQERKQRNETMNRTEKREVEKRGSTDVRKNESGNTGRDKGKQRQR